MKLYFSHIFVATFICLAATVSQVDAATLGVAPTSPKVNVGNIVSVRILVSTDGLYVNNAEGTLRYPTDLLDVMSVSKTSSIFNLWVEEPQFSNGAGTITFNGGLPTPGYNGQSGEVISIVFKAKRAGTASLVFSDGAVRKNDGLGTDVLTGYQNGTVTIGGAVTDVPAVTTNTSGVPAKPVVTSVTHPNQDAWYSGTTATLSWNVPQDITSTQTLLTKNQNALPTTSYDASVSQRTINNINDGVYYFVIRQQNSTGWGGIAKYKMQIDSTSPDKFAVPVRLVDARDIVTLNATDALSGIDAYLIQIDEQTPFRVRADSLSADHTYSLPPQAAGDHVISVVAYDKAANKTESHGSFTSIEPIAPIITLNSVEVVRNTEVVVSGTSIYPSESVRISLKPAKGETLVYQVETKDDGSFEFKTEPIKTSGTYTVTARMSFASGAEGPLSNVLSLLVSDTLIVKTSKSILYGLSYLIPAVIALIILILSTYVGWHKFFGLKRRMRRESQDALREAHKALMLFKDELANQLKKLEKIREDRDLNRKEEKIFKELTQNIDSIDQFIEKKIKSIK